MQVCVFVQVHIGLKTMKDQGLFSVMYVQYR